MTGILDVTEAPPAPAPARAADGWAGTARLVRLNLRRDRVLAPLWIVGLAVSAAGSVGATADLYPTIASRVQAANVVDATAAIVALYGRIYDPTSLGALSLIKLTALGAAIAALLFGYLAVRHTRADEEPGRLELIAAGAVGRRAPLTAALFSGALEAVVLGVVLAASLMAVSLPWRGSLAFGLSWTVAGLVFTAVGALVAQLTTSARTATGLNAAVVAVAYVLRAIGDLNGDPGAASWLSPIGWSQQLRPYAGDRWAVALLPLVVAVVLAAGALTLSARRDLGAGLLVDRPGPAAGTLRTAGALALRLHRGALIGWSVGTGALGLVLGTVATQVEGMLTSDQMRAFFASLGGVGALEQAFVAAELTIGGAITTAFALTVLGRARSEEAEGRAELVLSTGIDRMRWYAGHLVVAVLGLLAVQVVLGLGVGLGYGVIAHHDAGRVGDTLLGALAQAPASWVVAGLVVVLFGWLPRAVPAGWGVYVALVALGTLGELWRLPGWVMDLSPFTHSPRPPLDAGSILPLAVMTIVAAALIGLGLVGWRRRSIGA